MTNAPQDRALDERMRDASFARAYDVWLLVLAQQAAQIELARSGLRRHRPGMPDRRSNHRSPSPRSVRRSA